MLINMLKDYYFWFAQPSTLLNNYDWGVGYFFAAILALGIIVWVIAKFFISHPVTEKLLRRYSNALIWFGVVGLLWFGFRYQAAPIFSKRIFAGIIILGGIIWLGFIKYYFVAKFFKEKKEFDYNVVKNRYIGNK